MSANARTAIPHAWCQWTAWLTFLSCLFTWHVPPAHAFKPYIDGIFYGAAAGDQSHESITRNAIAEFVAGKTYKAAPGAIQQIVDGNASADTDHFDDPAFHFDSEMFVARTSLATCPAPCRPRPCA